MASKLFAVEAVPAWDETFDAGLQPVEYPDEINSITGHPLEKFLPFARGYVEFSTVEGESAHSAICWGVELSANHDETCDALDMELFDYSDCAAHGEDYPASSFILTRMVAEAYNRMAWDCGFRIGVAVADEGHQP